MVLNISDDRIAETLCDMAVALPSWSRDDILKEVKDLMYVSAVDDHNHSGNSLIELVNEISIKVDDIANRMNFDPKQYSLLSHVYKRMVGESHA